MEKQIATDIIEGTRKRGRPSKRWWNEEEEDFNIMGIKKMQTIVRDRREWRKVVLEAKVQNGL
jgi:hypothetical protein